jgi:hypothetical protein
MKKDFVYFFKHNNINAIKIGKASGESVLDRFNSFRTYAPFGAEIVGFFETDNGHRDERELHQLFKSHRLQGEFFDISIDMVKNIIFEKNKDYHKAYTIFNEWMANSENDSSKLVTLMSKVEVVTLEENNQISKNIIDYITRSNFELDKWYPFKEEYDKFILEHGYLMCSKIAFKKNLEYYCLFNKYKLLGKRLSRERNKHYFLFKS